MEEEKSFEQEIKAIEEKIKDAEENFGDVEVRDAIYEKAQIYDKHGKKKEALETYQQAYKKTVGFGLKMDVLFKVLLIHVNDQNLDEIKTNLDLCNKLFEEGGDWERKNRLKVYEGIYYLMIRDFRKSSELFLQTISTFNSSEIITYNDLVFYTVLTSLISLPRSEIKEKIVHSPEVLSAINEIGNLKAFLDSFYKCDYKNFFVVFLEILGKLPNDTYLAPHRKYFTREMRVVIYSQFLESYKTVTLQTMADAFGVSVQFIDKELSELISARRLNCKIDKVAGVIESERIDERNRLYKNAIREGDFLLNKIQKLSRFVDI